ncbi:cytochrome P450 [Pisolithus microcarpus]|nr:cytochrome P450 [Pisolithus microcarpus]
MIIDDPPPKTKAKPTSRARLPNSTSTTASLPPLPSKPISLSNKPKSAQKLKSMSRTLLPQSRHNKQEASDSDTSPRTQICMTASANLIALGTGCAGEREDDWSDKPNDILQWLIDEKQESLTRQLALRVLTINFASIHVRLSPVERYCLRIDYSKSVDYKYFYTSVVQSCRLTALCGTPPRGSGRNYPGTWVDERGDRVDAQGFLAETQRLEGVLTSSVQRKAMKDLTLSDGTFVPKGTHLCIPTYVVHRDSVVYDNPGIFNPFWFSQLSDDEDASARHQMVGVTQDYLPFGFGKHACPGRFLAANEVKTMLAYIVMSYDVKFEGRVSRPSIIHWDLNV